MMSFSALSGSRLQRRMFKIFPETLTLNDRSHGEVVGGCPVTFRIPIPIFGIAWAIGP